MTPKHLQFVKRQYTGEAAVLAGSDTGTEARTTRSSKTSTTRRTRSSTVPSTTSDVSTTIDNVLGSATMTIPVASSNSDPSSSNLIAAASASTSATPEVLGLKQPIFIAIVAAAGAVLLLIAGLIIYCCCRRRRKMKLPKVAGWTPIDSPVRTRSEDEKREYMGDGATHELSYTPSNDLILPVRPISPFQADFEPQPSPTTPHSAQPLLQGGPKLSYSGFYHPPSPASLRVPGRRPTIGMSDSHEADTSLTSATHYGMAISTPTLVAAENTPPPGPTPILFAVPPQRQKQAAQQIRPASQVDDVLNSFSQAASPTPKPSTDRRPPREIDYFGPGASAQTPMKNIGRARQPMQGQVEHHRLSIRSEAGEVGGSSPDLSPIKAISTPPQPQPAPYTPAEPFTVPDIIVRSNSRDKGERYIFGHALMGSMSSVGSAQILRQTSLSRSQHPPKLVSRQESLKRAAQPCVPEFSPASREEAQYSIGQAAIIDTPESAYSEFPPSVRDSAIEADGQGLLTLQQMAMKEQHADFDAYRSPTYSIYGAYALD